LGRQLLVLSIAVLATLLAFLLLPVIQTINQPFDGLTQIRTAEVQSLEAPPQTEEPEEEEPEEEEPPPELSDQSEPLDLAQLDLALSSGFGDGLGGGDFAGRLSTGSGAMGAADAFEGLGDMDQKARATFTVQPNITDRMRKKGRGRVTVVFQVSERGRVESPRIESSSDPVFNEAALAAIKQWRFDAAQRRGKPVRSPNRQTFSF
jgi:TonB family protein